MNEFRGVLSYQTDALLGALRVQRDVRCREITAEAKRRAEELVRDFRTKRRDRVREVVAEERRRRDDALREARCRLESRARQRAHEAQRGFLDRAWPALRGELERRWSDGERRRAWCAMLLDEARSVLPAKAWRIEVGSGWVQDDRDWLLERMRDLELPEPELQTDDAIGAGLRVRSGDACLDGTVDGLLAARSAIEAQLLAAAEPGEPQRD